ncbi:hypothetical protein [Pseudomonas sp. TH31]|uniref:hypothetical protein n=1 Tax=Pseudomonas sp. TH31 TaxID=2796396 RepID=UPI001F5B05FE|nr:hypothetical protein [Pseudomonas sp. TH31]
MSSKSGSKAHPSTQLRLLMRPINTVKINTAIAASFLIMINCYAFANLTPLQQQAKSLGLERYNQYKVATPALSIAAEAGDREAQFYLAEELRQQKNTSPQMHKNGMRQRRRKVITTQYFNLQHQKTIIAVQYTIAQKVQRNQANG